jgi:hypothetical protein
VVSFHAPAALPPGKEKDIPVALIFFRVSYNLLHGPCRKRSLCYCSVFSACSVATSTERTTENTASPIVMYSLPRDMFTGPLSSNGCHSVVGCALVATCLPSNGISWFDSLIPSLRVNPSQYTGISPYTLGSISPHVSHVNATILFLSVGLFVVCLY